MDAAKLPEPIHCQYRAASRVAELMARRLDQRSRDEMLWRARANVEEVEAELEASRAAHARGEHFHSDALTGAEVQMNLEFLAVDLAVADGIQHVMEGEAAAARAQEFLARQRGEGVR